MGKRLGKIGGHYVWRQHSFVKEVKSVYGMDIDVLSLAFTNPLPKKIDQILL